MIITLKTEKGSHKVYLDGVLKYETNDIGDAFKMIEAFTTREVGTDERILLERN